MPKRTINGLAWFAGIGIAVLLAIVIGANFLLERAPTVPGGAAGGATRIAAAGDQAATPAPGAAPQAAVPVAAAPAPGAAAAPAANDASVPPSRARFVPPAERKMPEGEYGKVVRYGEQLFLNTGQLAKQYVGNDLNCSNCHLDAGRQPNSAPLWAAFVHYPAYRSKTKKVDTLASRLQGCFQYSMNGKAPPADDPVITALQTYAFWLATGAAVNQPVEGSGYPKLPKAAQSPDYARGEQVYAQNCALCHGPEGQGQRAGDRQVFPPLWGARSFNWGAGMHQVSSAAGFIKANMPLGKGGTLTDQQAWDVAYFMDAHERPQDPRFRGSVAQTRTEYHDDADSLYGLNVNGRVLGAGTGKAR